MDREFDTMRPASFTWRGNRFRVARVLDCFTIRNEWWNLEEESLFWRVELIDQGVMDLEQIGKEWRLSVIFD